MLPELKNEDIDRAVRVAAYRIASGVYAMLARERFTVDELKARLATLPPDAPRRTEPAIVDSILRAENSDKVTCSALADIAFVMGYEWDFRIAPIEAAPADELRGTSDD